MSWKPEINYKTLSLYLYQDDNDNNNKRQRFLVKRSWTKNINCIKKLFTTFKMESTLNFIKCKINNAFHSTNISCLAVVVSNKIYCFVLKPWLRTFLSSLSNIQHSTLPSPFHVLLVLVSKQQKKNLECFIHSFWNFAILCGR